MPFPLSLLLAFLLIAVNVSAQKEKAPRVFFYAFDAKGEPGDAKNATYVGMLKEFDDTTWQYSYYRRNGPLIYVETYRDKQMQQAHGYVALYDNKGRVDTTGCVYNQRREGWWNYYNDSLALIRSELYENGRLVKEKTREDIAADKNKPHNPDDNEAIFKGGTDDWKKYLAKQLRVQKINRFAKVKMMFTVGIDGYTHNFRIQQSVEISCDEEAMRAIRLSPRWRPARSNGKLVDAEIIQPISFNFN